MIHGGRVPYQKIPDIEILSIPPLVIFSKMYTCSIVANSSCLNVIKQFAYKTKIYLQKWCSITSNINRFDVYKSQRIASHRSEWYPNIIKMTQHRKNSRTATCTPIFFRAPQHFLAQKLTSAPSTGLRQRRPQKRYI